MTTKRKTARRPALKAVKGWPPQAVLDVEEPWANELACDIDETIVSYLERVAVFAKQMYPHSNLDARRMRAYDPGFDPQCTLSPYEWESVKTHFLSQDKGAFSNQPDDGRDRRSALGDCQSRHPHQAAHLRARRSRCVERRSSPASYVDRPAAHSAADQTLRIAC